MFVKGKQIRNNDWLAGWLAGWQACCVSRLLFSIYLHFSLTTHRGFSAAVMKGIIVCGPRR